MKAPLAAWLVGGALAAGLACSDQPGGVGLGWAATGDRAAFPSPLTVNGATAIKLDATNLYWITTDGFLYYTPRAGGDVSRLQLPAVAEFLSVHNDVYVGWTDGSGNAVIQEIDPPSGNVKA